jgi:hypothetical protein
LPLRIASAIEIRARVSATIPTARMLVAGVAGVVVIDAVIVISRAVRAEITESVGIQAIWRRKRMKRVI